MQGFLTKIVALVAAAVLALPPGICCGMNGPAVREVSVAGACCNQASHSPAEQQRTPAQPMANCCCTVKAATTSSTVQAPESATAGFFAVELLAASSAIQAARSAAPAVVFTGPPLRILQCVWRI